MNQVKTVYIIGAGSTAKLGIPTSNAQLELLKVGE